MEDWTRAMLRYRPMTVNESRIEIYPTSQWGLLGDYAGPENAVTAWAINPAGFRRRQEINATKGDA